MAQPKNGQGDWWWRLTDEGGGEIETADAQCFPTRSDAESWVGEMWQDLADQGIAAVTLLEGDHEVYGPMSLSAPD